MDMDGYGYETDSLGFSFVYLYVKRVNEGSLRRRSLAPKSGERVGFPVRVSRQLHEVKAKVVCER
jgi:hypothetical protein